MFKISVNIAHQYSRSLVQKGIDKQNHYHYQKWLRYYLGFCHKYQQKQASHAIKLYYESRGQKISLPDLPDLPVTQGQVIDESISVNLRPKPDYKRGKESVGFQHVAIAPA